MNLLAALGGWQFAGYLLMPLAWVKLAPQGPVSEHNELPGTIFACMAGQVAFRAGRI